MAKKYIVAQIVLLVLAIAGYITNLVKLLSLVSHDAHIGSLMLARTLGVFAPPLGAILGFL